MRFLTRSLVGLFLLALSAGLLLLAAGNVMRAIDARGDDNGRTRAAQEREFAVNVDTLTAQAVSPIIIAYGEVESARTLEIRPATSGQILEMSDGFQDGGSVTEGETLFVIDPADAQADLELAQNERAEARAELDEAVLALELANADVSAAEAQRDLRAAALTRQEDLLARGAGTSAATETAALSLSAAEQTLVNRRQALATAKARIDRARITLERREISVTAAERALADTRLTAPFSGLVSEVSSVRGRLVNANEKLGVLIDPDALEVAFRVSNAQFARLIDEAGTLRPVSVTATLALEDIPITVTGQVVRVGAEVGTGQTGRLIYAALNAGGTAALRPGDFLTVRITEPEIADVAVIPATAASNDGRILLIGEGDRLEEAEVTILRRQADSLIIGDAPFGREYATERLPQIGAGIKVRPVRPGAEMAGPEMIRLDPERRARLIVAVEANTRMPAEARERVLNRLAEDEVPAETVARIEARMGGTSEPEGQTITLAPERRAQLIAFVEANERMPADVKERLLAQLNQDQVPADMVERLESRIGG